MDDQAKTGRVGLAAVHAGVAERQPHCVFEGRGGKGGQSKEEVLQLGRGAGRAAERPVCGYDLSDVGVQARGPNKTVR